MQETLNNFVQNAVSYLQSYGILFGCFIIVLESIIPVLPLGVFIAFNMIAFGSIVGFLVSWISTIIGCCLSYFFFKKVIGKKLLSNWIKKHSKVLKIKKTIKKMSFSKLVLITALPFSPAFLINIACGIANMKFRKFLTAIILGKISIVIFWGFISKSLLESITDIKTITMVLGLLIISYVLSKLVTKKLDME